MTPHETLKEMFACRNSVDVAIEISGFTSFRTTLIDELTDAEAAKLVTIHQPSQLDKQFNELQEDLLKREWKSKILALAERTGIKEKNSFGNFNDFMLYRSIYKKHLNAHTLPELQQCYKQLRALEASNKMSAKNPMTKAWWKKSEQLKHYN